MSTTYLRVILDRSGSMSSIAAETVDKFNEYINKVKLDKGDEKIKVTLAQFDDEFLVTYENVKIEDVKPLVLGETYQPRGMTALLDAIGKTMAGDRSDLKKKDKGICVIMTDGFENASSEFKNEDIKNLIQKLEDDSAWTFVFLGANQDAFAVGQNFGIRHASNTLSYGANEAGTSSAFANLASATVRRSAMPSVKGMASDLNNVYFTEEVRYEAEKTKEAK